MIDNKKGFEALHAGQIYSVLLPEPKIEYSLIMPPLSRDLTILKPF